MQQTATIRHAQRKRDKTKHDGREPQRKPHDKAEGCWTTRGTTTPETIDSKQYMESIDATTTTTSTAAAIDGIQYDAENHDTTTDDATTDDADPTTATDWNERDADAPNSIWSTATATTVENDVTIIGREYM